MPEILIEHTDHGRHVVYTNAELEWHKARGWKLAPEKVTVTKAEPAVAFEAPAAEDQPKRKKRQAPDA